MGQGRDSPLGLRLDHAARDVQAVQVLTFDDQLVVSGVEGLQNDAVAPLDIPLEGAFALVAVDQHDLGMALASLGLEPMIIPGEIEAALTFLGVAQDFGGRQILVADSGGGSTELALGNVTNNIINLPFIRSLDVGCRRVTDRFLSEGDIPTPAHLGAAHAFASRLMRDALVAPEYQEAIRPEVLVATGGTATSLIAMNAQLEPYDPAFVHLRGISVEDVQKLEELLAKLPVEERAKLPGLQEKRAPVILGGTIVLFELMQATGFTMMIASESDLLFGLLITAAAVQEGRPSPVVWKPILKPLGGMLGEPPQKTV